LRAVGSAGTGSPATQLPATQSCPAAHALPHAPQCCAEAASVTSHPLAALPSQFAEPAAHSSEHAPAVHTAVVFGAPRPGHARPQPPQCCADVASAVSHPLAAEPSQSP